MKQRCSQGISDETLSTWRAKLLSPAQQEQIGTHIAHCVVCQGTLAEFERVAQILRTPPLLTTQETVWRGVHASMSTARGSIMASSQKRLALAGVGAACSVVLLFVLIIVLLHPQTGTKLPVATATTAATAKAHLIPTLTEFALPTGILPDVIITGADGNLWFTDQGQLQIGRMTPTGSVTLFKIPSASLTCCISNGRDAIVVGPDKNLWFTEANNSRIARITTDGVITEFPLPNAQGSTAITIGADKNLWFTLDQAIGRMTLNGTVTIFPVPSNRILNGIPIQTMPNDITSGPDGNLWFTEFQGEHIGRITPRGDITQFPLPNPYTPAYAITSGADGNLWFTDGQLQNNIGRITPQGKVTEFPIQAYLSLNNGISRGPDGNLWFTTTSDFIEKITPQGLVTPYSFPTFNEGKNEPIDITLGPDGNLWITEKIGKIGRIVP